MDVKEEKDEMTAQRKIDRLTGLLLEARFEVETPGPRRLLPTPESAPE
jgi:hypothetical protein